jgi:hypothetical protein
MDVPFSCYFASNFAGAAEQPQYMYNPVTLLLAQTQHLNHEPQTAWNILLSKELRRSDLLGHREVFWVSDRL